MTYKADDEITLTFSGLKQAQNEAFQDGIAFTAAKIEKFLATEPNITKILEFIELFADTKLYAEGDEEECSCEENCDAEGCEA